MLRHFRQLLTDTLIYGLSGIALALIQFVLLPIYTRVFSPEDYGVLGLLTVTLTLLNIFVILALDAAAGRFYWESDDTDDRKQTFATWIWCQYTVSIVLAAGLWLAADALSMLLFGEFGAAQYVRLAVWTLPLGTLVRVVNVWLRFRRQPWPLVFLTLVQALVTIGLTIWFVVTLRWGLKGVYVAQIAALSIGTLVALVLMRDWVHPRHFRWPRLQMMLRFSTPLIPSSIAQWVVGLSDRFFLQAFTNIAEVGLYQVGSTMASSIVLVTNAFQQAWAPYSFSIHQRKEAPQVYANVFLLYTWFTCLIGSALSLFAPELLRIIASPEYLAAANVISLLTFSHVMTGLLYIAAVGPAIVKKTAPIGIAITAAAFLNVVLNLMLTPMYGRVGSAAATLISQSVMPIYLFYKAQQLYPIPYRFRVGIALFALTAVIVLLGHTLPLDRPWLTMALKAALLATYAPALILLRIITPAQLRAGVQSLRRVLRAPA